MNAAPNAPSPFWKFSLAIYGRQGVPPACLTLQNGSGVDVNVLLFGLYAASRGRRLDADNVTAIVAAVDAWKSHVVVPLRGVRTWLKQPTDFFNNAGASALRDRVKGIELEAERLQQEALFAAFPMESLGAAAPAGEAARDNARAYERHLGATFDNAALAAILAAFDASTGETK